MKNYNEIFKTSSLWKILTLSTLVSFSVLLYFGGEIYQKAPPLPDRVVSSDGEIIYTLQDIQRGQNVWQSLGGMQKGTIWGHGSYLAPDWSADWLHREAQAVLEIAAQEEKGQSFASLSPSA
ncbi:MAG TPA: hypothetical protein VIV27_00035, partial [Halioglobus sp.]